MKKQILTAVAAVVLMSSCLKQSSKCEYPESNRTAPAQEVTNLNDSLAKYGITNPQTSPSGFMYKIKEQGSGPSVANLCSNITVHYKGRFFNGTGFDSTTVSPAVFPLGGVILGWQKGIPLVNQGGKIDLYIPPSLAYGYEDIKDNSGKVVIPKNSYLVFEVEVLKIN